MVSSANPAFTSGPTEQMGHGDMENAARFCTSPHPRLRLRTRVQKGATLTFHLVQKIGPVTPTWTLRVECHANYLRPADVASGI